MTAARSAIYLRGSFNFPENSEFEATLTFTGTDPGSHLRSVAPTPQAVTVRQHHSFVQLPADGYTPRKFDPRSGFFPVTYQDYSAPIGEEFTKRYTVRHRLEKKDPSAEISEAVEPIIFYLDNGTPEPVRTALLDGARWWAEAFEDGDDAVSQLEHILTIREAALLQFGERNIREGRPMSDLEDVLVPVYLYHRYQTEATVKLIGGVDYAYNLRGDGQAGPAIVEADRQRRALQSMLRTIDADVLALPEHLLDLIPPRPARIQQTREHFRGYTSPVLDPVAIAEVAADHAASLMFNAERGARLTNQKGD